MRQPALYWKEACSRECGRGVIAVVHAPVPVREHVARELGGEADHAEAEVGAVEVEVVRHRPHHDQVDVLAAQLPRYHPRRPRYAVLLQYFQWDILNFVNQAEPSLQIEGLRIA